MYKSSGSQFFRNTTEIKSELDPVDESGFFMTFLTILGATEIYYAVQDFTFVKNTISNSPKLPKSKVSGKW